ncbi:MAG TPA: glutathione peroxidase [Pseudomonadales bacterium]|nr:glutathione peroxidase [Pseudomonadales bacterium]
MPKTVFDFAATAIDGQQVDLSAYAGKVLLIVNTASKCGFTPQYKGLQKLFEQYTDRGLVVLGFPCDQFGHQEPGDEAEINSFCEMNFGVSFPLFAKIDVNGKNTHPLFAHLKTEAPGLLGSEGVKWNFTKFLVDRNGKVAGRYAPATSPEAIAMDIEALLKA